MRPRWSQLPLVLRNRFGEEGRGNAEVLRGVRSHNECVESKVGGWTYRGQSKRPQFNFHLSVVGGFVGLPVCGSIVSVNVNVIIIMRMTMQFEAHGSRLIV